MTAPHSGVRGVLFDLDDTLFDDAACMRSGLSELARHYGCEWPAERIFARHREIIVTLDPLVFSGKLDAQGAREARFGQLLREWQVAAPDPRQAARLYRQGYVAAYATCEGALEMLAALRAQGLKVGILTNYLRGVQQEKVERCGLAPHIDALLCSDDVPAPKPDARAFHAACAALGLSPGEVVMVGDSLEKDVLGAQAAGLRAVWYNPHGSAGPGVAQVRQLAELPGKLANA